MLTRYYFDGFFQKYAALFESSGARRVHYEAGEPLVAVGDYLTHLFYVERGLYKCSAIADDGVEYLFCYNGPGSLLPVKCEAFYFTIETSFSLVAITPVDALLIEPSRFAVLVRENPELGIQSIRYHVIYSNMLTSRVLSNNCSSLSKVCNFLYVYCNCAPVPGNQVPLSQNEVASATSLSRIQVARVYQSLKSQGVIEVGRGCLTVKDMEALKHLCSDNMVEG